MINIFVLEDEILQQSRIENTITEVLTKHSWKCKEPDFWETLSNARSNS